MDDIAARMFATERTMTARRLMETIDDIRSQLNLLEDAVKNSTPVAGGRSRQVLSLASDAAALAGALDTLVRWGSVIFPHVTGEIPLREDS